MKSDHRITLLICSICLVILQCIVYAPALNNAFVHYDDDTYVYENANIKALNAETVSGMFARPFFRSYTPLALVSHAVDYAMWKENPWGHHLTNLVLHSINVVLAFLLCVIIISKSRSDAGSTGGVIHLSSVQPSAIAGAAIAATLYSLHPMRVESVAWVSDRKDLLLVLFLLPSIAAYMKYDEKRGAPAATKWFMAALLFNALALLSKSIATVTPLLLLSLDTLLLHRSASRAEWKKLLLEKTPFLLLSVSFGLLAMWAARGSQMSDMVVEMTTAQKVLMPLFTLVFYLAKFTFPAALTPIYTPASALWMAAGTLLALVLIVTFIWLARRGRGGWLLAFVAYALPLLPIMTGLATGIQPWADRYTYLSSVPVFILVGAGCSALWERSRPHVRAGVVALAASIVVVYVFMDRQQIAIWKDSETLWRTVVREAPTIPNGYDNLGVALAEKGDVDGALKMYRVAIRLYPSYADAYYNAACAFQTKGLRDSAVTFYRRAIASDSEYVDAYINLGNILADEGSREEAIRLYDHVLEVDPDNADAYYNLGCAVYQNGDRDKALQCFMKAIKYSPAYSSAYYNMGIVFLDQNNVESALQSFVRAARLGSVDAQNKLARAGYSWK